MNDSWLGELRRTHDEHFDYGWHEHVRRLNGALGLEGPSALGLAAPGLPPRGSSETSSPWSPASGCSPLVGDPAGAALTGDHVSEWLP